MKSKLEDAAGADGKSLSEEIEHRLEQSFAEEAALAAALARDFGDETTLKVMRALATAKSMAEGVVGGDAYRDPETAKAAHDAMVGVLDALFAIRPSGPTDTTNPTDGQQSLISNPLARSPGQNIRDAILEAIAHGVDPAFDAFDWVKRTAK